jgi:hypothetical protein
MTPTRVCTGRGGTVSVASSTAVTVPFGSAVASATVLMSAALFIAGALFVAHAPSSSAIEHARARRWRY